LPRYVGGFLGGFPFLVPWLSFFFLALIPSKQLKAFLRKYQLPEDGFPEMEAALPFQVLKS
jgi:hypothetical protein